jgi:hypothetical protein
MGGTNNETWNELWVEVHEMYLQRTLGMVKAYLHQSRYRDALSNVLKTHWKPQWPVPWVNYTTPPTLTAKFYLCEVLARTGSGLGLESNWCMEFIKVAARLLSSGGLYSDMSQNDLVEDLQKTVNTELTKLGSSSRCAWPPSTKEEWRIGWRAGEERHSSWELLDLPEE